MTTFTATNHQNKGRPYIDALLRSGYTFVEPHQKAHVLLTDHDAPINGYREMIQFHRDNGATVIMLPHGANPNLQWDGIWEPQPVAACVVPAPGHEAVMKAYGYPNPIRVLGWPWTPINTPKATDGRRILFAPIHPDGSDYLPEPERAANHKVFEELLTLGCKITVRYLGSLEANGLRMVASVTYNSAVYDNSHHDILGADVVVTSGTYAYHSIALGVPTVMYFQGLGTIETETGQPKRYAEYKAMLDYPVDALEMGTAEAVNAARQWSQQTLDWRAEYIGVPFDAPAFVDLVDSLLPAQAETTINLSIFEGGSSG